MTGLDLAYNKLTEIPNEINGLDKMTILVLSNNQISKIPNEMCTLRFFKERESRLHLDYNSLTEFLGKIGETGIDVLMISNNQLETLQSSLEENYSFVIASHNQITYLPESFF